VREEGFAGEVLEIFGSFTQRAQTPSSDRPWMCLSNSNPTMNRTDTAGRPAPAIRPASPVSIHCQLISPASRTSSWRMLMICSNRERNRFPHRSGSPFHTGKGITTVTKSEIQIARFQPQNPRNFRFGLLRQRNHISDI
jgi:hypothetical protein